MHVSGVTRRRLMRASLALAAVPALQGCAAPLPTLQAPATTADAQALLDRSAAAHGLAALARIDDMSVSYAGEARALVGRLQPVLVDAGYRRRSEERLLLRDSLFAQAHTGPAGHKQVVRQTRAGGQGDVRVWFNGDETHDAEQRDAAALVVDGYCLFLLGPMLLARLWARERALVMEIAADAEVVEHAHPHLCDVLRVRMTPGLGLSEGDEIALFIDRDEHLMRRVRMSLNGLDSTRGAIVDVDMFDHVTLHGVRWPTRFHEQLLRPLPLPVHDWHLTGLDVNRGLTAADVGGPTFSDRAAVPAGALAD